MEVTGTAEAILATKGKNVYWVSPEATVYVAIEQLADRNVGCLLVMENGRLIGVFSERDYTRKVALLGRSSRETTVREVITGRRIVVTTTTPITECMRIMTEQRIRHLPVIDDEDVIGVISIGDLVNYIMNAQRAAIEQLQSYISGGYPG